MLEPLADAAPDDCSTPSRSARRKTTRRRRCRSAAWEYYARTAEGAQYADSCRRPRAAAATRRSSSTATRWPKATTTCRASARASAPTTASACTPPTSTGPRSYTIRVRDLDDGRRPARRRHELERRHALGQRRRLPLRRARRRASARSRCGATCSATTPRDDEVIYEDLDERFFVGTCAALSPAASSFVQLRQQDLERSTTSSRRRSDRARRRSIEPRDHGIEYETVDDGERVRHRHQRRRRRRLQGGHRAASTTPGRAQLGRPAPHRPGHACARGRAVQAVLAVAERGDALTTIRIIDQATRRRST